jgi:hypothetical protein
MRPARHHAAEAAAVTLHSAFTTYIQKLVRMAGSPHGGLGIRNATPHISRKGHGAWGMDSGEAHG